MTMSKRYYITHTDESGERHQIGGAYEADSPAAAVAQMLHESQADDDGRWEAFEVASEDDVI